MCGIFFYTSSRRLLSDKECDDALSKMRARGPDVQEWDRVGDHVVAHTRLSIVGPAPEIPGRHTRASQAASEHHSPHLAAAGNVSPGRNYAMATADPSFQDFDKFAIRSLVGHASHLTRRQTIRLYNLELFHRMCFEACDDPLGEVLSARGREFCGLTDAEEIHATPWHTVTTAPLPA